jgi:rhodanese-related sulfurtransferase
VSQLTRAGFNAVNLRGGMIGWQGAGFPVKKGK